MLQPLGVDEPEESLSVSWAERPPHHLAVFLSSPSVSQTPKWLETHRGHDSARDSRAATKSPCDTIRYNIWAT